MTKAYGCEQLAQGCYQPRFKPATFWVMHSTVTPHRPPCSRWGKYGYHMTNMIKWLVLGSNAGCSNHYCSNSWISLTSECLHRWASLAPCMLWTRPHSGTTRPACCRDHRTSLSVSADTWSSSRCWFWGQRRPCPPRTVPPSTGCETAYTSRWDWPPSCHTTVAVLCPENVSHSQIHGSTKPDWNQHSIINALQKCTAHLLRK